MNARISHDDIDGIRALLVGRTIEVVDTSVNTLTLDDGTVLEIEGNEGCGGCSNGYFEVTALNDFDNRIMKVDVAVDENAGVDHMVFEIFVYGAGPKPHLLATVEGGEGNGYYGVGFTIYVVKK